MGILTKTTAFVSSISNGVDKAIYFLDNVQYYAKYAGALKKGLEAITSEMNGIEKPKKKEQSKNTK